MIGPVPVQAIEALPYILTVVLLAGFIGKAIPPKASGVPYVKERLTTRSTRCSRRRRPRKPTPTRPIRASRSARRALAPSGAIYGGCNVENAAYPEGGCAETAAIAALALAGERRIVEILVVGDGEALCAPCGGCRQRIREFADAKTRVHVAGPEGVRATFTRGGTVAAFVRAGSFAAVRDEAVCHGALAICDADRRSASFSPLREKVSSRQR